MALSKRARERHEAAKEYASLVLSLRVARAGSSRAERPAINKSGAEIRLHRAALGFAKKSPITKPAPKSEAA